LKDLFIVVSPPEPGRFLEELDYGLGLFNQFGQEAGNGCKAAYEALDLFDGSGTVHLNNCLAFFGIGLYAALGQHKSEKFTTVDSEYTLVRVEAKVVLT